MVVETENGNGAWVVETSAFSILERIVVVETVGDAIDAVGVEGFQYPRTDRGG